MGPTPPFTNETKVPAALSQRNLRGGLRNVAREADPDPVLHTYTTFLAASLTLALAGLVSGCHGCEQTPLAPPSATTTKAPEVATAPTRGRVEGVVRAPKGTADQTTPPETAAGCVPGGAPSGAILLGDGAGLRDTALLLHPGPRPAGTTSLTPRRHEAADRTLTLRGCTLDQRTLVARVGDRLVMHNEDARYHTLGLSKLDGGAERRTQTVPLAPKERDVTLDLTQPGFYRLSSDQLPWLRGLLLVLRPDEEGAVTGPDGDFTVLELQPGSWNASIRHEVLGETKTTVEVVAGETAALYEELAGGPGPSE